MSLEITFVNGDTAEFPFGPDSTLSVETPDGVNGVKRAVWGEVASISYGAAAAAKKKPAAKPKTTDPAV